MVLPSALEVGTVYSRSVIIAREIANTDDRSGHRPQQRSRSVSIPIPAYNAFLQFSEILISRFYPLIRLFLSCLLKLI
jgi:hypothetical protein